MNNNESLEKNNIIQKLFFYSVPLIMGNIVILSYDLVDALVISKVVGEIGLAAVSNAGQISSLILLFFYGICMGASVIISEFFGAKDYKKMKVEVSTTLIVGTLFTTSISILVAINSKNLLSLMGVPNNVLIEAVRYLKIACIGLPFVFIYNVFANAMRAMGNSKVPTFFLALSAIMNIFLDIIFVAKLNKGVAGASVATVVSQITTCILTYLYVELKEAKLRLGINDYIVDKRLLVRTVKDGMVTALQQAVPPLGRTLVVAKINSLGVAAMAANGIITRIDSFALLPAQNLGIGIMTYVAQSRGAKRHDLIKDILKKGIILEMGFALILFIILFFFKYDIMVALSPKDNYEIINLGSSYLEIQSFGYFLIGFVNAFQCFFRGMGNVSITLYSSIINVIVRVFIVFTFASTLKLNSVAYGTIIGWVVMNTFSYCMYKIHCKKTWKDIFSTQK